MAGLTEEDLRSLEVPSDADIDAFVLATQANERALGPKESPEEVRARAIRRDIYSRHGIPPDMSDSEAAGVIMQQAMDAGLVDESGRSTGAWANPQEREAAQAAYTSGGGETAKDQWERRGNAKYLMDPQTASYMQNYQRDMDFLDAANRQPDADVSAYAGTPDPAAFRQSAAQTALEGWDRSNSNPLSRNAWNSANYGNPNQFIDAIGEAITNPELPAGNVMYNLNIPYESMALKFGGEADSWSEAVQGARGNAGMAMRYRPNAASPILDLPSDASSEERSQRVRELRTLNQQAAIPSGAERWQRTTGYTPPAPIVDVGDLAMQMVDPTLLIPVGGAAANIAKSGIRKAAKPTAAALAKDFTQEQITGAGLLAGLGGSDPSRAWTGEGGYLDLTPPPAQIKDDQQLAEARDARRQQFEMMQKDRGASVSSPRTVAYNR
jgi:hypothetical protein